MTKQVIGPRIPGSWFEHLDDENWDDVDTDEIDSWVSQDLIYKRVLPSTLSVNHITARLGRLRLSWEMSNAVYTLECAHCRHLLAACAQYERSQLIRGLSFPRTETIGYVCIDDLVVLSFFAIFKRASSPARCTSMGDELDSSPIEVQRAGAFV